MVLIQCRSAQFFIVILGLLTLNACSHLGPQKQNNRSPDSPIIPVKPNQETTKILPVLDKTKPAMEKPNQQDSQTTNTESIKLPTKNQLSPPDVLASVISSAKKAISMQQWLRAQHHLEHALRIAPKDAQVFLLYAEVYEGLGVKGQEINMLKRAIFLAQPKSEIYELAKEKLTRYEL
tara:strand:- start:200 stop:733 length:534 start_codon:yes stop_codon:yes gene_type:complete